MLLFDLYSSEVLLVKLNCRIKVLYSKSRWEYSKEFLLMLDLDDILWMLWGLIGSSLPSSGLGVLLM